MWELIESEAFSKCIPSEFTVCFGGTEYPVKYSLTRTRILYRVDLPDHSFSTVTLSGMRVIAHRESMFHTPDIKWYPVIYVSKQDWSQRTGYLCSNGRITPLIGEGVHQMNGYYVFPVQERKRVAQILSQVKAGYTAEINDAWRETVAEIRNRMRGV